MSEFKKFKKRPPSSTDKRFIFKQQNGRCNYCGKKQDDFFGAGDFDHIIRPKHYSEVKDPNVFDNYQFLCTLSHRWKSKLEKQSTELSDDQIRKKLGLLNIKKCPPTEKIVQNPGKYYQSVYSNPKLARNKYYDPEWDDEFVDEDDDWDW